MVQLLLLQYQFKSHQLPPPMLLLPQPCAHVTTMHPYYVTVTTHSCHSAH